ncbi:MAG: IS66 family transposase [Gammaproteobacteria bacterium]|nr:IS66 family transposase [Gammaproteobacteria bacterium]
MIKITEDIVVAHAICECKSYLMLFQPCEGSETSYAAMLRERKRDCEKRFFGSTVEATSFCPEKLGGKAKYIINASFYADNYFVNSSNLKKQQSDSKLNNRHHDYEPLIVSDLNNISCEDKIRASYIGYVLGFIQDRKPTTARIILADGRYKSIKLKDDSLVPILKKLNDWLKLKPKIPPINFSKHCGICQFEQHCLKFAEADDSIALLGNMPASVRKRFESKGVFTIKQLSYVYKPRRRSKCRGDRKPVHQYELQALAIRTKYIYTSELLELYKSDVEIYVDIESIPDKQFHYLIGVLVTSSGRQLFHSFWADDVSEQQSIWSYFLEVANKYPTATIYHYGSYEKKVITELSVRYGTDIDNILNRLCNLNSYIYGRIYFPTRSNRLKDICNYLGHVWTADNASGLSSIVWRYRYDKKPETIYQKELILYNKEDCINLKRLKDVISAICSNKSVMHGVKAVNDKNQLLSNSGKQIVDDFSSLIKSAHGKYESTKISFKKDRNSSNDRNSSRKYVLRKIPKSKIDKIVRVARGRVCPVHKRKLLSTNMVGEVIITDLVRKPKGITKQITKYWGYKGRCPNCSPKHNPPRLKAFGKRTKYGDGLRAWVAYQRLTMRLPFRKISQLLEDSFTITIASGGISSLFSSKCSEYRLSEKNSIIRMMQSEAIHVDETLINIQGKTQYVWVFTDGIHVLFKLTPTRNSSIAHEILKGYKGVLISDYFSGYDAIECCQQKCWVHLIRDINEDVRKSPFDLEFESFVISLRELLMPIFNAVEKYGLKRRNLNKFTKIVEVFYANHVFNKDYQSDITKKYVKRLSRYKQSLFVFLERDSVPWNNNMAERALRHLAVQRKISGSFTAAGMENYLLLLGVMQTCRFQNKPFLEFLMSGDKDIDNFKGRKKVTGWSMR